jgi:hypothetical protein
MILAASREVFPLRCHPGLDPGSMSSLREYCSAASRGVLDPERRIKKWSI